MQTGVVVVDPVQAVVEGPPVDRSTNEVARMVVGVIGVATVVLQVVDRDDAPSRVDVRNQPNKESLLPVENKKDSRDKDHGPRLHHVLAKPGASASFHLIHEAQVVLNDRYCDSRSKLKKIQQIPTMSDLGRPHDVLGPLHVAVVTEV